MRVPSRAPQLISFQGQVRLVRQAQVQKRLHRFLAAAQGRGIDFGKRDVAVGGKKLRRLPPPGVVEAGIDAAALHNALRVEVGLAVAEQVNGLDGHGRGTFAFLVSGFSLLVSGCSLLVQIANQR